MGNELKRHVFCHAKGDRCLGCAHYRREADVCEFARPQPAGECGELVERLSAVAEGHRSMIGLHSDKLPLLEALEDAITALSRPQSGVWVSRDDAEIFKAELQARILMNENFPNSAENREVLKDCKDRLARLKQALEKAND